MMVNQKYDKKLQKRNKALGYIILKNKMYKIYYTIKFLFAFKYIEFYYYIIIPYY